jgi:hypothetical protein
VANGFTRRVAHRYHRGCGNDLDPRPHRVGDGGEMRLYLVGLSDQQRAHLAVITERLKRPGDVLMRRVVAAHYIDGDGGHAANGARSASKEVSRRRRLLSGAYSWSSTSSGFSITRLPR